MKCSKPYFFLALLFMLCSTLPAQELTYDLSDYKARFERRPGMQLNFRSDFDGRYITNNKGSFDGDFGGFTNWFLNRNTDELISNWSITGSALLGRTQFMFLGSNRVDERDRYFLSVSLNLRQDRYQSPNQFWGYEIGFTGLESGTASSLPEQEDRTGRFGLNASLYKGTGRIEFAEDALLARWMLQDLQTAGVTSDYSAEDVQALAETITFIIGNRVFDFRRRRIYELEQLQQTLLERGVTGEESFLLFAVLNDNWAFANRATLTHGNRFAYGVQSEIRGNSLRESFFDTKTKRRFLDNTYGLFTEYTRSRIVKNNNGSNSFTARLDVNYYQEFEKFNSEDTENVSGGWQGIASLNYTRTWLPNSRTTFRWSNTLSYRRFLQSNYGIDRTGGAFFGNQFRDNFVSSLFVDYFVSYQWAFRLQAAAEAYHIPAQETGPFRERTFGFYPQIQFSTNYFFF